MIGGVLAQIAVVASILGINSHVGRIVNNRDGRCDFVPSITVNSCPVWQNSVSKRSGVV